MISTQRHLDNDVGNCRQTLRNPHIHPLSILNFHGRFHVIPYVWPLYRHSGFFSTFDEKFEPWASDNCRTVGKRAEW